MISLDPRLRILWGRHCYWGFRWSGKEKIPGTKRSTAIFEFRWLYRPRADRVPTGGVSMEIIHDTLTTVLRNESCAGLAVDQGDINEHWMKVLAKFSVFHGQEVRITMKDHEIDKFQAMIRLQWTLVNVGAASGAARYGELSMYGGVLKHGKQTGGQKASTTQTGNAASQSGQDASLPSTIIYEGMGDREVVIDKFWDEEDI